MYLHIEGINHDFKCHISLNTNLLGSSRDKGAGQSHVHHNALLKAYRGNRLMAVILPADDVYMIVYSHYCHKQERT